MLNSAERTLFRKSAVLQHLLFFTDAPHDIYCHDMILVVSESNYEKKNLKRAHYDSEITLIDIKCQVLVRKGKGSTLFP